MKTQLQNTLEMLEAKQHRRKEKSPEALPVYYGWAKLNKVMKREALMVIFLNDRPGPRIGKDGYDGVTKWIVPVYKRIQTAEEMADAKECNRMYSAYSLFMDDRQFHGSLQAILDANNESDRNHVSEEERLKIAEELRKAYMDGHPHYKDHGIMQTSIHFE